MSRRRGCYSVNLARSKTSAEFFTGRAGMKFQGAANHTHCIHKHTHYPLHSSFLLSPSFPHIFLATPLLLPHSLTRPSIFLFGFFFLPLSLSLLSCFRVKFSRCTWWQHHPGAPVSCLPSSRLLCCHRGNGEVNLETVATINSCILLF